MLKTFFIKVTFPPIFDRNTSNGEPCPTKLKHDNYENLIIKVKHSLEAQSEEILKSYSSLVKTTVHVIYVLYTSQLYRAKKKRSICKYST